MRKVFVPAAAAAAMLLAVLPMTAASAAPKSDVLTIKKVGGANVAKNATLQASLKSGAATFYTTAKGKTGVKCTKVSFTDKVTKNPTAGTTTKPSTATESLTKQTFNKCTSNVAGTTNVKSVKVNTPRPTTISDAKGFPVTVIGTSTTLTLGTVVGTLTCTYKAKNSKTSGVASNTGQTIKFTNQIFTLSSGSSGCPKTGYFSATFGPVRDTSVKGSPAVFVN